MVFVIAECGVNFTSFAEAVNMMAEAKRAGADAVKFQLYNHDTLCTVYPGGEVERHPLYDDLMKIRMDEDLLTILKEQTDMMNIELIVTPMYVEAVEMLEWVGLKRYKIRYADRYNIELIKAVHETRKPIILSCNWDIIKNIQNIRYDNLRDCTFMYCIPEYPPDSTKFILSPKNYINSLFKGYSNHYPSIIPPLMAVARGAEVIEVHVKLDGTHPIDDAVSIDMTELAELCRLVRKMEEYL